MLIHTNIMDEPAKNNTKLIFTQTPDLIMQNLLG